MDDLWQTGTLAAIGGTPLVELSALVPGPGRLLAKAEYLQPGGSMKDRSALGCIRWGREQGHLAAGQAVVEMTSGNMGAGLAIVCHALGHPFRAYMSSGNSPQRAELMRALGAEVVLVDQVEGGPGMVTGADIEAAAAQARAAVARDGAWYVDQFSNPGAVLAHETGTGPELWAQSGGRVDAFVACVGTGGTLLGVARHLRSVSPQTRCFAVEPATSQVLAGRPVERAQHVLQGSGYGSVPPQWDGSLVAGSLPVTDDVARQWRKRLGREAGLHVGYTAAANVAAAAELLATLADPNAVVVTILSDSGFKYDLEP